MLELEDQKLALELLKQFRNALSVADHTGSLVNQRLIQNASDLLEKYGADGPTFAD